MDSPCLAGSEDWLTIGIMRQVERTELNILIKITPLNEYA